MSYSEFELIRRCFIDQGLGFDRSGVALGIGDDAAIVRPPDGTSVALSLDTLIEGVHFPKQAPARLVARRAFAVNLSDMAAMGAEPLCFTLGLTLPQSDDVWVAEFAAGLLESAKAANCPLVGGDTTRGPLAITIQVHGFGEAQALLRRSSARVGDIICVTGTLGDAATALLLLGAESHLGTQFAFVSAPSESQRQSLLDRYYTPQPMTDFALRAREQVNACIDLSDGLLGDLAHILDASGVGARVDLEALPFSDTLLAVLSAEQRERAALGGGDDYELCFTVPPESLGEVQAIGRSLSVAVTPIGEICAAAGLSLRRAGESVESVSSAYRHF